MIVVVCAGGPAVELCALQLYMEREEIIFIGADRGAYHLLERGIVPHIIVGDFDSVDETEWTILQQQVMHIEKVSAEKDETDTELALALALQQQPSAIVLTGVTGGRLDHYEAALRALYRLQIHHQDVQCSIVNQTNELRFLVPGRHDLPCDERYDYVSFFAYVGDIRNVTLRGVKYETTEQTISRDSTRFTSNEILSEGAYIEFTDGICLMIRSTDENEEA